VTLTIPAAWKPHIDDILLRPGVTVVTGDIDTGKTSFCSALVNRAIEAGISTAVVDCDLGQSQIGPPATVGLGLAVSEIQSLRELKPERLHFVGNTSPAGHLLATITSASRLARLAGTDRQLVIVDTPGLVTGLVGRRLQSGIIETLSARHVVALQKADEAEHYLRFFDTWANCTVHRLPIAPGIRAKTLSLRVQHRAANFQEYFLHSNTHDLPLASVSTSETWLRTGDILEPKYLRFAQGVLRTEIPHGERIGRGIYLVAKSDYNRRGMEELQEQFKTRSIIIIPASRYLNLLVGLLDDDLELLALGIVKGIAFQSQIISVLTPLRSISPVRSIRFGALKLRPDGVETGRLRPGEL
jgi:polynucleotide 5'-hydroxyl-kinase GRC3/NOL9